MAVHQRALVWKVIHSQFNQNDGRMRESWIRAVAFFAGGG